MRTTASVALRVLGAALAVLVPSLAHADVIEMPASCPEGSAPAFCHGPPTCAPRACVSPSDCAAGEVCAARSLCVQTNSCYPSSFVDDVLGPCDASGACTSGACQSLFVCAPGPMPVDAGTDAGRPPGDAGVVREHTTYCGCRAGSWSGGTSTLGLLLGTLALLTVRRARRPGA